LEQKERTVAQNLFRPDAIHGIHKASNGYCNCAYFECSTCRMSSRCRALVGRIGEELRKKKPEHFVDEGSLADFHASLECAAWVLEQKTAKGLQERSRFPGQEFV